jgi:hypothetical protein
VKLFAVKKTLILLLWFTVGPLALCQNEKVRIGKIEFFGVKGFDVGLIRSSLPLTEGQEISANDLPRLREGIGEAVKRVISRAPTDVGMVCCDESGAALIYVGLPQPDAEDFQYKPRPTGTARLPDVAGRIYDQLMDLNEEAVRKLNTEDDSKGYALSSYPPLRARQMAMREFALGNVQLLRRVVLRSADDRQRAIAAFFLGYARRSAIQIKTLVSASRDADEVVRNNAVRALGVLARSSTVIARSIPADGFIGMLNSGTWTDRNKAGLLLGAMTRTRDPRLLHQLRLRSLPALIEMARWRSGHANDARMILGRVARIPETELLTLVAAGDAERIISAAQSVPPPSGGGIKKHPRNPDQ